MNPNQTPEPQPTYPVVPPLGPTNSEPLPSSTNPIVESQTPPTYNQVTPMPVAPQTPIAPASTNFGSPINVDVQPTGPLAPAFGLAIGSASGASNITSDPAPTSLPTVKKPLNKKLIIIIAAIVAIVIIAIVAVMLFLPNASSKLSGGLVGNSSNAESLVAYEGEGYSISLPANFKAAPLGSSTSTKFTKDGLEATGKTATISVIVAPFSTTNTREQSVSFFSALKGQAPADTEFSKDNKSEVTTVDGFEALKSSGASLESGVEVGKASGMYVLGNKNMYIISIIVPAGDDSSIDAEAIINSFKTNE